MSWVECSMDCDYEIFSEFPYDIRNKRSGRYLSENISGMYPTISMKSRTVRKHIVIMSQFKPHEPSEEKLEIDHINRDRSDYHLSNLRWISHSENMKNKIGSRGVRYDFFDDISDEAIVVRDYGDHEFEDLYFHENTFYKWNGIQFRKLHINETKGGSLVVSAVSTEGERVKICYTKFKRLYDVI
jgi:hypothetical protein